MTTFSETTNARFIQKSECNIQGKALPETSIPSFYSYHAIWDFRRKIHHNKQRETVSKQIISRG